MITSIFVVIDFALFKIEIAKAAKYRMILAFIQNMLIVEIAIEIIQASLKFDFKFTAFEMILTSYLSVIMENLNRTVWELTKFVISTGTFYTNKLIKLLDWFFDQNLWTVVTELSHRIQTSFTEFYITLILHSFVDSVGSILFLDLLMLRTTTKASIGQSFITNTALHHLLQFHDLLISEPKFLLVNP